MLFPCDRASSPRFSSPKCPFSVYYFNGFLFLLWVAMRLFFSGSLVVLSSAHKDFSLSSTHGGSPSVSIVSIFVYDFLPGCFHFHPILTAGMRLDSHGVFHLEYFFFFSCVLVTSKITPHLVFCLPLPPFHL